MCLPINNVLHQNYVNMHIYSPPTQCLWPKRPNFAFHVDGWSAMMFFHALVKVFIFVWCFKMLELLKFAKKYPVTDGGSCPIIDVRQATYFSPSSTARSASSSQGYPSLTLVQACGPNYFQSVSTSTDRPPIQSKNGPAACLPGSNTPEGSVITVATRLLDRVLKTQMVLPRLCQVLPFPQGKLDGVLSSSATRRIGLPFNPKMVLPLVLLVLIPLHRRKPEGSAITVLATCLLDRVLKTQMLVLPRLCQVLPPPQR
jgi:hypothetical protein